MALGASAGAFEGSGAEGEIGSDTDERRVRIPLILQRIQVQRKLIWNRCMGKNIDLLFISVRLSAGIVKLVCVFVCVCMGGVPFEIRPVLGLFFMLRANYIELLVHQL